VRLASVATAPALDIQREYLEAAPWTSWPRHGAAEVSEHGRVLDLWARTLDAIETDDLDRVDTEIDWVIKRRLLDEYASRHGLGLEDPRIWPSSTSPTTTSRRDRGLHLPAPATRAGARVVTDVETLPGQVAVAPPARPAAKLRGDFIRAAQ
jgi:proteasome accessory factor A